MTLLLAFALFASPLLADSTGEWRSYGATAASTKYAPFDQIDATNFAQLEIAWTWASADQPILDAHPEIWTMVFEGTPLQVGDRLPVSTPTNDYYGGHRPGDNLFAESLVCLNAATGERVWHFQVAHHGMWDYDLPAAPNLVDINVGGREIKAVAQVTKQGFCFVFDRQTGEPIWPIEEKPVPQSDIPGEKSSPTQPIPSKPAAFERQGLTEDDLIDFTPTLHQMTIADDYSYGPLYIAQTMESMDKKGTILVPGIIGGASWAGAAVDPHKGVIYIPSYTFPAVLTLTKATDPNAPFRYTGGVEFGPDGPRGLPLLKPPYGRITAVDLNTGEHRWQVPVGEGPRDQPSLAHLDLPPLGWAQRNFPIITESLLFAATQAQTTTTNVSPRGNAVEVKINPNAPYLWAFDPDDGALMGKVELPRNASGQPITYMAGGKQYIAIPTGGADQPAELVALSLP